MNSAFTRSLRAAIAAVALAQTVCLAACKQDLIMHDAAAFKEFETQAAPLIADIKTQPVDSCLRVAELSALAKTVQRKDFTFPTPAPSGRLDCAALNANASTRLGDRLEVLQHYVHALARAGTGQSSDLKLGAIFKSLKADMVLKSAPDAGDVDTISNAVVQFAANHERARFIKDAVLSANDAVQDLAKNVAHSFLSSDCDSLSDTYCAMFYNELLQACTTYGNLFELAHGVSNASTTCQPGPASFKPSAGTGDIIADMTLLQRYYDARGIVAQKIATGRHFALVVRAMAAAHQDLYDLIKRAPDADTAIFDR